MNNTPKTYWKETPQPYHDFEVSIEEGNVIFKEWWDPGHDPNKEIVDIAKFAGSKVAENIRYHLGDQIHQEIQESVDFLLKKL